MKPVALAFILICLLGIAPAHAGPSQPEAAVPKPASVLETYVPPSYANIARAYWAMNVYDIKNDEMVDNFLKITECDLYSQFYRNEFEWKKIRETTREYLQKYKNAFPRRFEYVQPIYLDRYDFNLKGFGLMPDSAFVSSTRLEIYPSIDGGSKCEDMYRGSLEGYPRPVELLIKNPFQLRFLRVNEDLAKEYLKMLDEDKSNPPGRRPAFIRFRIRFDQYVGQSQFDQKIYGSFAGMIETIEIFADRDLMFKLYEQSFF